MRLESCSEGDWPALPCALQQHPGYGRTVRQMGGRAEMFRIMEGNADLGRVQVVCRRFGPVRVAWVGRGPVWKPGLSEGVRCAALAEVPAALPGLTLLQPDDGTGADRLQAPVLMTAPSVAEIDLTEPSGTRMARQHGKWRNRLRRARGAGLIVRHRPLEPEADAALLAQEAAQRRARRYAALPHPFLQHWAGHDRVDARLITARAGGEVVAFMVLLLHAPVATYHIGWSGAEGRRVSAHHLMLWQASEWLADRGYARLDLGTVDTESAPGLARFKIGSGARIRTIGPTLLPLPRFLRRPSAVLRAFPLAIHRNHS
ncbi:MAG: GNAT family N-acetyltransferase [Roseovarius sp.]